MLIMDALGSVVQSSDDAALANDIRAEMEEVQRKITKAKGVPKTRAGARMVLL